MFALWVAAFLLIVSAVFLLGVPMFVLGPRTVLSRMFREADGQIAVGTICVTTLALVLLPVVAGPLIFGGDIVDITTENLNRLDWDV